MAKKGPKDVEYGEKFPRMLPCPITPAAADKKAREIVDVLTEITVQKENARPFTLKARELTLKVESLRHDIKSKTEDREVKCREERHYKTRVVRVVRLDTNAVVEERTMTEDDRQEELADLEQAGERKSPGKLIPMAGGKTPEKAAEKPAEKKAPDKGEEGGSEDAPPN